MNKKIGDIFSSFKTQGFQKIAAFVVLFLIIALLPILLWQVKQQQTINQNAAFIKGQQQYPCNDIVVYITPDTNDNCSTGTNPQLTSYQSTILISATGANKSKYTVHWKWAQFWCNSAATNGACLDGESDTSEQSGNLGNTITASSQRRQASGSFAGQACGFYQNDFGFYVTNSSGQWVCGISTMKDLKNTNNNAAFCHTTNVCSGPTPTPTIPQDTPTPTIPEDSPTPTLPVDSPTPTLTIDTPTPTIPQDTPNPSATPTPTSNPTDTPTPTTPDQPTDTPTTVIVTNTPKPTLPPTGPGNTIVSVGLIGAAIVVIGLAFAIGL